MPLITVSFLIVLAAMSSTMLNASGENRHPCLAPDLRGKALSLSLLSIMFPVGF